MNKVVGQGTERLKVQRFNDSCINEVHTALDIFPFAVFLDQFILAKIFWKKKFDWPKVFSWGE